MLSRCKAINAVGIVVLFSLVLTACQQPEPRIPLVLDTFPIEIGSPNDIAVDPQTGYVYIINHGNRVAVLKEMEQVALLETDPDDDYVQPNAIAIDAERGWVYVPNYYADTVTVIRGTEVAAIVETAGRQPEDVAVEPTSGFAYVVTPYQKFPPHGEDPVTGGNVTVINGTEIMGMVPLGDVRAMHVVADPVHGYVYVGGSTGTAADTLGGMVIVLKGMEEMARVELDWGVDHMDVNRQTGEVFVSDGFYLHRFAEGKLLKTMRVTEGGGNLGNMQVHPTTGDIYLIEWSGFGQTEAIVIRDFREIGRLLIGSGSAKMAIDPMSGNVYMADYLNDQVTVIHGTEVIATLETGWYPYGIGVNPANGWVYVSNTNEGTISVLGFPEEVETP